MLVWIKMKPMCSQEVLSSFQHRAPKPVLAIPPSQSNFEKELL